nr:MAG TPA: hypothetical protein [Bacteriophage sp.]DAP02846.1 MAG TPA: hypothetical protein [Caudoviricetes sp.]
MFYRNNSVVVFVTTLHTYICTTVYSVVCTKCFRVMIIHIFTSFLNRIRGLYHKLQIER